jgi:hypothetical protein
MLFSFLLIFSSGYSESAEVYYLGSGAGQAEGGQYPSYSPGQRIKDLFDFASVDKPLEERSGQISGTFMQEMDWNNIAGNKSKSFLTEGVDYLTEINLNMIEKLKGDYRFEGQLFLRKTDNDRIESRNDVRIKQYDMKILNARNLYEFGQFYGDYSGFVLNDSLEGFNVELQPAFNQKYGFIVGRSQGPDESAGIFQRNVFGFQAEHDFAANSEVFSKFQLGVQMASSQDDSASVNETSAIDDLNNYVYGVDGEFALRKYLSVNFELARSRNIANEDITTEKIEANGTAFRVQPKLNLGRAAVRYLFYYVHPEFYSDTGSAVSDKMQHQVGIDINISRTMLLNLTDNLYWDHLEGSSKTRRTTTHEKQIALNWKPFAAKPDFMFRPYVGFIERYSDDPVTTVENRTRTAGFAVNTSLNETTVAGLNYEYRGYSDDANNANSDYINRFGFNYAKDTLLLNRRLYYSLGPSFDIRRTKADSNIDFNTTLSANCQWDATQRSLLRFGLNVTNTNSARVNADFLNTQDYLEYDYRLAEKRDTHVILRGENNRYDHEDGSQEYREYRVIAKFLTRF